MKLCGDPWGTLESGKPVDGMVAWLVTGFVARGFDDDASGVARGDAKAGAHALGTEGAISPLVPG